MPAAAVPHLSYHLIDATKAGEEPDDWPPAALEISAGAALLAGQPALLSAEHAQAVALAAAALSKAGRLDDGLELSTHAVELHQQLAAAHDDLDPLPALVSPYQHGALLAVPGRHGDAIAPLEQAIPVLLAHGRDIPSSYWTLLRNIEARHKHSSF